MDQHVRLTSYLVYRFGTGPEEVILWDTLDVTIGRLETQDLVVPDPEVSREHAVFRKSGDIFTVEDLGSALGTHVNGERIRKHELTAGDVIQIGTLALKFDQTPKAIRPGGNVRFASQLKDFGSESAEGGRTMLGIAIEDDVAPTLPPQPVTQARGMSADGSLDEIVELEPLAADFDDFPTGPQPLRNLDLELAPDLLETDADASETIARLEFEVKGPGRSLKAVLAALQGKRIQIPPFTIRLRDRRPG